MKIKILDVPNKWLPDTSVLVYPQHSEYSYGVEQDFYKYIKSNPKILTNSYKDADFYYLPVYWLRVHFNYNYKPPEAELCDFIDSLPIDKKKVFVICDVDLGLRKRWEIVGKYLDDFITFNVSEEDEDFIGIPLLTNHHKVTKKRYTKKYIANFVGCSSTYPLRKELFNRLKNIKDVFCYDTLDPKNKYSEDVFVNAISESYLTLCPRGSGINSYRFFESMQLGTVPIYIGDKDCRPFRNLINWDDISFKVEDVDDLIDLLSSVKNDKSKLLTMGNKAKYIFDNELDFQKWEKYVLNILYDKMISYKNKSTKISFEDYFKEISKSSKLVEVKKPEQVKNIKSAPVIDVVTHPTISKVSTVNNRRLVSMAEKQRLFAEKCKNKSK